jgi:Tat protein translocase TatB subunit
MINFPGPEKILILAIIALVVLGPSRLPQAARTAGKWIAELRKLTARFQEEVSGVLDDPKDSLTSSLGDLRNQVGGWRNDVAGLGRSMTAAPPTTSSPTVPTEPATWTNAPTGGSSYAPSNGSVDSVSSGPAPLRLPALPPVPDDPSLN